MKSYRMTPARRRKLTKAAQARFGIPALAPDRGKQESLADVLRRADKRLYPLTTRIQDPRTNPEEKARLWKEFEKIHARMNRLSIMAALRLVAPHETPLTILKKFGGMEWGERYFLVSAAEMVGWRIPHDEEYNVDLKSPKTREDFLSALRQLFGEVDQLRNPQRKKQPAMKRKRLGQ